MVLLLRLDESLNFMQCLVVHFVQEGFEAPHQQPLVCFVVWAQEFLFRPALDGYRANVVGVVDVENNDVCVAPVGGDGELACLIAGDDTVDGMYVHENEVGACVEWFLGGFGHVIVDVEAGHVMNAGVGMVTLVGVLSCVEQVPFRTWSKRPIVNSGDPVMWRHARWDVRPCHPLKYPRSMAWMREDGTG